MNQDQNNLNQNNFNMKGNNDIPNPQPQLQSNFQQQIMQDNNIYQQQYVNSNHNPLNNIINNMINNTNSLDEKLLMSFIGNNYNQIMQQKFSIPALFLSWIYTLYRKVYVPSIIGMVLIIILGFLPSTIYTILVLAFVIVLGINFNKWYVAYAKKQVEKIKVNNQSVNENELINICKKKGGTNIWLAILIYVIFAIVSGFLNPNLNNFYNSEDSYYSKVDLLSKVCLGDKNNAQAYIEQNVVKIKYDFGSGKSGQIDLGINNPKKLYRMSTNSCDLGTLIVLTEEKDAYAISFKSNKNEITMGNLIKFNKKVNEVRFLGNQMNIEFKYEDNTTESFTHAKIEYECDSCSFVEEETSSNPNYYEKLDNLINNSNMTLNDLQYDSSNEIMEIANKLWKFANITTWGQNLNYEYDDTKQISKITNFNEIFDYFADDFEISVMNANTLNKKSFYEYSENNIYYGHYAPNQRGSNYLYKGSTNISIVENLEDKASFDVISIYCSDENWYPYLNQEECSTTKEVINKFIIQKEEKYWKIKYFVLPN